MSEASDKWFSERELGDAKTQLDKVREMRREIRHIDGALTRMEMLLDRAIQTHKQKPLAQRKFGDESTPRLATMNEVSGPLEGWVKSLVESYLAIIATIGIASLRTMASSLSGLIDEQRAKHERASLMRGNEVIPK